MKKTLKVKTTNRGIESNDGALLSNGRIKRGMTHAILWPRPDGGYLIEGFARSTESANRRLEKCNRRIKNPMFAANYVVAEVIEE